MESPLLLIQVANLLLQRLELLHLDEFGSGSELSLAKLTLSQTISWLCEKGDEPVPRFVVKHKDLLYDLEDVVDAICTLAHIQRMDRIYASRSLLKQIRNSLSLVSHLPKAFLLSRKVSYICAQLKKIAKPPNVNVDKYVKLVDSEEVFKEHHPSIPNLPLKRDPLKRDPVVGRDTDKTRLIDMILSEKNDEEIFLFVSVVGMGGVGKTTLASLVYKEEAISHVFEVRIWACVSTRSLVSSLVETSPCLRGYDYDQNSEGLEFVQRLLVERIGGKKFLLVLDDAWTENQDDWAQLRHLLLGAGGAKGSKVLVTTCLKTVPEVIGNCSFFELQGLSDEDSWNLFKKVAFEGADKMLDRTVVYHGKCMVRKCLNLPLAIKVMGCFWKRQGTNKWKSFLDKELADISEVKVGVINVLKLSYDHLPSCLKSCLAYCSVFPKNCVIAKRQMIRLWMAQGFMNPTDGESLEDIGEAYFKALLQRNFFDSVQVDRNGEIKSCQIHGLIHDVAQVVAGGECVVVDRAFTGFGREMRHLYITNEYIPSRSSVLLSNSHCTRLRTFINSTSSLFDYQSDQHLVLRKMGVLNARCLRSLGLRGIECKNLPSEIGGLHHLRYLDLSFNYALEMLPRSIIKLVNLQTFDISHCQSLKALPSSFRKLASLRHLDISGCHSLTHMPPTIGSLICLRTLTMFVVGNASYGCSSKQLLKLKFLANLRGELIINFLNGVSYDATKTKGERYLKSLSSLKELCIEWRNEDDYNERYNCHDDCLLESLEPHPNLMRFKLDGYNGVRFNNLESCVNLVKIFICDCPRLEHLPLLSHLCHLKELELVDLLALEYVEVVSASLSSTFFSSLERLVLNRLPKLKGWRKVTLRGGKKHEKLLEFPCLVKLWTIGCDALTSFPRCLSVKEGHCHDNNPVLKLNSDDDTPIGYYKSLGEYIRKMTLI